MWDLIRGSLDIDSALKHGNRAAGHPHRFFVAVPTPAHFNPAGVVHGDRLPRERTWRGVLQKDHRPLWRWVLVWRCLFWHLHYFLRLSRLACSADYFLSQEYCGA